MSTPVHISSLIVQAQPTRLEEVAEMIISRGAEIPARDPCGKLVVILETESETTIADFLNDVAVMDGVLSANLVFHHIDDNEPGVPIDVPELSAGGKS
ncbi:MAG: chaperone NapD [Rhodospirillales bacterium]